MNDLGDFFSLIGEEKRKKEEKQKELIGEVTLGDLFASLSEEKRKLKDKEDKKAKERAELIKNAKVFETFLFSEPKKEVDTSDWRDNYVPTEIETTNIIEPEPLKPSSESEIIEESIEELETLSKIRKDVDVEVDKSNNILKSIELLDKLTPDEEIDEDGKDSDVNRLRREITQLRKMVYETVRQTSTIGGGGAGFLKDLDDVSIAGIQSGYVLTWDEPNNKWVPRPASQEVDLGPLTNVAAAESSTIPQSATLSFNYLEGQFISTTTAGAATTNIAGFPVTTGTPPDNTVLTFDSSLQKWIYDTPFNIVDLSDNVQDGHQDYGNFT